MRIISVGITILILFLCSIVFAQDPPYPSVTIMGRTNLKYNKVSLFESGSSKEAFKSEYVSDYDGEYSIEVYIPDDMIERNDYYVTDMRFWGDKNDNDIRDPDEPVSQCHFIIWRPDTQKVYMQIYKGPKYMFESSILEYDYN